MCAEGASLGVGLSTPWLWKKVFLPFRAPESKTGFKKLRFYTLIWQICRASLCSRKRQGIEKYCKDSAEHKDWVEQWTVSPQDGRVSTGWTVSPQGGLCLHKVDGSPQGWLCPRKVDCAYKRLTDLHKVDCVSTRLTVSTQDRRCLHKIDGVSTRWTVSPQVNCVSTR